MRLAVVRNVLTTVGVMAVVAVMHGDGAPTTLRPGALGAGIMLLPNGWKIAPAGIHRQIGDLPLAMVESPDGRSLLVTTNGYAKPTVAVYDIAQSFVRDIVPLDHAWLGMAWHPDGKRLYVSGAGNTTVHEMRFNAAKLTRGGDFALGRPMVVPGEGSNRPEPAEQSFIGGIAVTPDGSRLFAVHVLGRVISAVDLKT